MTFGTISFNKNLEAYRHLANLMSDASDFGFDSTLTSAAMLTATAILSAKGTKREMVPVPAKLNAARAKTATIFPQTPTLGPWLCLSVVINTRSC
jgi:hypothetical protein